MLLNNKSYIREKFNIDHVKKKDVNSLKYNINNSNQIVEDMDDDDDDDDDNCHEYLYTTNNVVVDKLMVSNIEYNGIPSKTSINNNINTMNTMNTISKNDIYYTYDVSNKYTQSLTNKMNYKIMIFNKTKFDSRNTQISFK